jgi:hypothetical protein
MLTPQQSNPSSVVASLSRMLAQDLRAKLDLWGRVARRTSLVACPILLGLFLVSALRTLHFIRTSVSTQGTITALVSKTQNADTPTFAPVFQFDAPSGTQHTVTSNTSNSSPEFTVGQTVTVLYHSSEPDSARISSFWQLWTVPIILGPLGLFFGLVGYALLRLERRRDGRGAFRLN